MSDFNNLNRKKKFVFIRIDLNLTVINKKIFNINKLLLSLPSIIFFLKKNKNIVLCTHLGNPKKKSYCKKYSILKICEILSNIIKKDVLVAYNLNLTTIKNIKDSIIVLENIRFYEHEKTINLYLSKYVSRSISIYLNNSFSTCHRNHVSTYGITKFIKNKAIGFLFEKEINIFCYIRNRIPLEVLISGGMKDKKKLEFIMNIINGKNLKWILFGSKIHNSLKKNSNVSFFRGKKSFFLPRDFLLNLKKKTVLDIGKASIKKYLTMLCKKNFIIWNGPLGFFEHEEYQFSTEIILNNIVNSKENTLITGGGETTLSIDYFGYKKNIFYMSTGGGALLYTLSNNNVYL